MTEHARYLYAVCRDLGPAALADVPTLGDGPLEAVPVAELRAVVSTVDLAEFGEQALRANLERLDWVERTARGHDVVVQACAALAPTAPMRLATIFHDDDSVRRHLLERYDDLDAALTRVAGCAEWSVKVFAHAPSELATTPAEPAVLGGAAYLRRKKATAEQRQEAEVRARDAADRVETGLRDLAVAHRRLRPQDPRLSGSEEPMLLNAAFLVEEHAGRAFADRVGELAAAHPEVSVACGGPWPPHSFATAERS